MWQYDFLIFYEAGRAVLAGLSPYAVDGFISPYPLAVAFAAVAWLPAPLAYGLYVAGCLGLLWKVMRWRMIWPLLSFPVLFTLYIGQLDMPLALLTSAFGVMGLPLLLTKPQTGFVLAPWYIRHGQGRRLVLASLVGLVFLVVCFVLRPAWLSEWAANAPSVTSYASIRDSTLHRLAPPQLKLAAVWLAVLVALPAGFLIRDRREARAWLHLAAPASNIYSVAVLAEWIGPAEVLLSWAAIAMVNEIDSGAPMFIVAISILIRSAWKHWSDRHAVSLALICPCLFFRV